MTDWRWNAVNVAAMYGPTIQSHFASSPTMPYTYPSGDTYNVCPDILLQPILRPVVMILVPATLDTEGGPLADAHQKVVGTKGIFAAGKYRCLSVINEGYFSEGAPLGLDVYTGWTAGVNAANNNYLFNQDDQFSDNMQLLSLLGKSYPVQSLTLNLATQCPLVIAAAKYPLKYK